MKLPKAQLERLEELPRRLTLEEVMMVVYERSCRRILPTSNDPIITELKAERGSVIVYEDEVVVVCNEHDFHLFPPLPDFEAIELPITPASVYLPGTTIVRAGPEGRARVSYVAQEFSCLRFVDDYGKEVPPPGRPMSLARWGGQMFGGFEGIDRSEMEPFTKSSYDSLSRAQPGGVLRILTCSEENTFAGKRAAREIPSMIE